MAQLSSTATWNAAGLASVTVSVKERACVKLDKHEADNHRMKQTGTTRWAVTCVAHTWK